VYGLLHLVVSILFFVSLGVTSLFYAVEAKSYSALAAFSIGLISWIFYWTEICSVGIAVPETTSSVAVLFWIIPSALKIYRNEH